jgi:hypothetical protein
VEDGSYANALALILTHVLFLICPEKPLFAIEAPIHGSGKGLLADVCTMPFRCHQMPRSPYSGSREEVKKMVFALALPLPTHVMFDNVIHKVDSDALALALTAGYITDRDLGHSRAPTVPVRCVWIVTGNNIQASEEIARRIVRIRLDPNVEKPSARKGFLEDDLLAYLRRNGDTLLAHALVIANAWVAEGCPRDKSKVMGSYPGWAQQIGGMLQVLGVDGFLANLEETQAEMSETDSFTETFFREVFPLVGYAPFELQAIYNLCEGIPDLACHISGKDGFARRTSLGKLVQHAVGRVIGDRKLGRAHSKTARARYFFKPANAPDPIIKED